jgi:hypothetical protein
MSTETAEKQNSSHDQTKESNLTSFNFFSNALGLSEKLGKLEAKLDATAAKADLTILEAKVDTMAVTMATKADLAVLEAKVDTMATKAELAVLEAKVDTMAVTMATKGDLAVLEAKIDTTNKLIIGISIGMVILYISNYLLRLF